jgi:hypothetical protein
LLKELLVALTLNTNEVFGVQRWLRLAEVPTEAEVIGEQFGHAGLLTAR